MGKLKLSVAPTFKAKVDIPVAGDMPAAVEFVFKHRTRTEMEQFMLERDGKPDIDIVLAMASDWDLDEPFDKEHVTELLENYMGASLAIYKTYIEQLVYNKPKN